MALKASVVICTHNPRKAIFDRCLEHLRNQDLPVSEWELIIVDNASDVPLTGKIGLDWHPHSRIVEEHKLGLSHARVAGVSSAAADLIIFVDDDNLLDRSYVNNAVRFSKENPTIGCFGGKSLPFYEEQPPSWFFEAGLKLGCQDYGDEVHVFRFGGEKKGYPEKGPTGTGMVILKAAFDDYLAEVRANPHRLQLGRKGNALTSGEDNDIVLSVLKAGWGIAYVPSLVVRHIIPPSRLSAGYLRRLAFESNRSWVKVLHLHGMCPWKRIPRWTLPLRNARSWFSTRAWAGPLNDIRWRAACGKFQGLAEIE